MDVIIIGGGLAGLAAGHELTQAGHGVLLIEARDRLGGRVHTSHVPGFPHPVELGPEWIDRSSTIATLLREIDGQMVAAQGRRYMRAGGGWEELDGPERGSKNLVDRIRKLPGGDRSLLAALDACCAGPEFADARAQLLGYVQGFHAADPARLSARWLTTVEANQPADASGHHSVQGIDAVLEALMPSIDDRLVLQLNTVVEEVRWARGSVTVTARREEVTRSYHAERVICTVPLPVLQSRRVRFTPDIESKRPALDLLAMGQAAKIVLRMRQPFWESISGLPEMLFLHDFTQPFPTWWTTRPLNIPLITGWAAGPQLDRLGNAEGEELLELGMESLAAALNRPIAEVARHLESWYHHDWRRDPFSLGAYSYVLVGGLDAYRTLAAPVEGTLYFAGEATAGEGYNATMEGAVQSGRRAAREVLEG
jgi:monoamine oxidase